ncbi:MAG: hypothetical protein AAF938_02505 [Myxococcota bacterium]
MSQAPQDVVDLATACIATVNTTVGIELDFTPETLPILDHYAKTVLDSPEDEIVGLAAPICGAYFGEVVRRSFNGRWHAPPAGDNPDVYGEWRVEFEHVFLYFNPIGVALDVILEGDGPIESHLAVRPDDRKHLQEALKSLGDVRESDYYSFAMRHEVLEQALAGLGNQGSFGSADYASHIKAQLN